jgi:hypothetical protein
MEIRRAGTESSRAANTSQPSRQTRHGLLLGLHVLGRPPVLTELCPKGWASARTYRNAWQSAATLLTLTLYSPSTVEVQCEG